MSERDEKIDAIRDEISKTKKNKSTNKHIGLLKAKLNALLSEEAPKVSRADSYFVKKTGNCQLSILGFPSVGKSSFLSEVTNKKSEVAEYEFTTIRPIVGMLLHKHILYQLVDLPGILKDASSDIGKGRRVIAAARTSDIMMIYTDSKRFYETQSILSEVWRGNIRLNEEPPRIFFRPRERGGITVFNLSDEIDDEEAKAVFRMNKRNNGEVFIGSDVSSRQLQDYFKEIKYMKGFICINKSELISEEEKQPLRKKCSEWNLDSIFISCHKKIRLQEVIEKIYSISDLIPVYTKRKRGGEMSQDESNNPLIMKKSSTIVDCYQKVFRKSEIAKGAFVQRLNEKGAPRKVPKSYEVQENDILTFL